MPANNKNFSLSENGLIINTAYSYFGASPDGLIQCDCCGLGTLEIKCPFTGRNTLLTEATQGSDFFWIVLMGNFH